MRKYGPSKTEAKQANIWTAAMYGGNMATKPTQAIEPVKMNQDEMIAFITANATPLEEVAPAWTPMEKAQVAGLDYFYVVSAEIRSGDNGEYYLFGLWRPEWTQPEVLAFGKGTVTDRDKLYEYVHGLGKPVGPMWLELVPTKRGNDLALFRDGKKPAGFDIKVTQEDDDIPF
jgi:hypothetical protein